MAKKILIAYESTLEIDEQIIMHLRYPITSDDIKAEQRLLCKHYRYFGRPEDLPLILDEDAHDRYHALNAKTVALGCRVQELSEGYHRHARDLLMWMLSQGYIDCAHR